MNSLYKRNNIQYTLITYVLCVGKTTLIKALCQHLQEKNISFGGFYTEELRKSGKRVGFDIVTLDGRRGSLARISDESAMESRYKVGQYNVDKDSFESLALPVFQVQEWSVLVIDEIGRMELFSDSFKTAVKTAFSNRDKVIVATIPLAKHRPIPFVEEIRQSKNAKIFTVEVSNRNSVLQEILSSVTAAL